MANGIDYYVTMDASKAVAKLDLAAVGLPDVVNSWLVESAELTEKTMSDKAPQGYSGGLKDRIDIVYDKAQHSAVVTPTAPYAPFVEFGTKPHMPPVEGPLTWWAEMHDLNPWAVAMGIKKKGTKAQPFVKPTATEIEPIIMAALQIEVTKFVGEV